MLEERTIDQRKLDLLRGEFLTLLMAKTGWGRNEIMQKFDEAMKNAEIKALMERITK